VINIVRNLGDESTPFIDVLSKELSNGLGIRPVIPMHRIIPKILNFFRKNFLISSIYSWKTFNAIAFLHSTMKAFTNMSGGQLGNILHTKE